ncbi:insulinase family protein, partial [Ramlibacter sp.]|uniref:M16 family metallopeptidase n=1 Tax=Ramlibacter sp. TaxID=1917967 RepID=UPI0017F2F62C
MCCMAAAAGAAQAALPIQHWTQPGGAGVWLIETHGLPMVDVQIDFDAGTRRDPAAKPGLASITALMSEKGLSARDGQPALDENQLSEAWADLGASLDAGAGADRMSFSLRSLTDPALLPSAVQLAARQLGEPAFPEAVWLRERARLSASIRESNTRPATVAGRAFSQAVYGSHPYGYETTEESLGRMSVADMRDIYAHAIRPCRAKISIVGDRTREQADALAAALLARLPQAGGCE